MHANLSRLSEHQARLRARCQELHPDWQLMFWNDTEIDAFVKRAFPWYYDTWANMNPLIKKIDTSRYMLMHHYGGVYLDVDVECVAPLGGLMDPLPRHAAWMGDFPEPMFLASAPANEFWLHALDRIKRVWSTTNAWRSTGPVGLNQAMCEWVSKHGSGVLVPYITQRTEPEFHVFIKNKNNTVPWFELSDRNYALAKPEGGGEGSLPPIWTSSTGRAKEGNIDTSGRQKPIFPYSKQEDLSPHKRVGFIANELLDPAACSSGELDVCRKTWCSTKWPYSYLVHHCLNTWRGRIGDSRRRLAQR